MLAENVQDKSILLVASDDAMWDVLRTAAETLDGFGVGWRRSGTSSSAGMSEAANVRAVIVASPDAALPAQWSEQTGLPTIRVPVEGDGLAGLALLRAGDGRLPAGPQDGVFATMAIGPAGAKNAALFVVAALANTDESLRRKLARFRQEQTANVLAERPPTFAE